jgi:hypothetical protein
MRGGVVWLTTLLGIVLGLTTEAAPEMYLWADEGGVVHMTNEWSRVPESARSRVSVRESAGPLREESLSTEQIPRPVEPSATTVPPLRMPSKSGQEPAATPSSPSAQPDGSGWPWLVPSSRPLVHHRKKISPPFPYNVQLDPYDSNFVWVGPNRVPKETFRYPRVSLDTQAQFRDRVRALEHHRLVPQKGFPTRRTRP